jgi:hypothetical protein
MVVIVMAIDHATAMERRLSPSWGRVFSVTVPPVRSGRPRSRSRLQAGNACRPCPRQARGSRARDCQGRRQAGRGGPHQDHERRLEGDRGMKATRHDTEVPRAHRDHAAAGSSWRWDRATVRDGRTRWRLPRQHAPGNHGDRRTGADGPSTCHYGSMGRSWCRKRLVDSAAAAYPQIASMPADAGDGRVGPIPDIPTYASWTWNVRGHFAFQEWSVGSWEHGFGANHEPKLVFRNLPCQWCCQFDFPVHQELLTFPRAPARSLLGRSGARSGLRAHNQGRPYRPRRALPSFP